jgi:hypothetical protein
MEEKVVICVICCEPSASEYLNGINKNITVDSSAKDRKKLGTTSKKNNNIEINSIGNKSQMPKLLDEVSKLDLGLNKIVNNKGGSELARGNKDEKKYYLVVDGEGKADKEIKQAIVKWKENKENKGKFERIKNNTYLVINNPCLEYYFLLHFENKHPRCGNADNLINELKTHWKEYDKKSKTISNKIKQLHEKYEVFKKNINSCESFRNDNKKCLESIYNTSIGNILNKDDNFWKELLPFTNMGKLVDEYIKKQSKKA